MRIDPHQKWHPVYLLQPFYNLVLAAFFEWGVALPRPRLRGDQRRREVQGAGQARAQGHGAARRGCRSSRTTSPFPALSAAIDGGPPTRARAGARRSRTRPPACERVRPPRAQPLLDVARASFKATLKANFTANIVRNVWSYAIIFCGHFPDQTYTFSQEEAEDETRGGVLRAPAARRGEHRGQPALPRDQRQPRLPGRAPPLPGHAEHALRARSRRACGRSASATSCPTTPGRSASSRRRCSARSCGWRSRAASRGRSPGPTAARGRRRAAALRPRRRASRGPARTARARSSQRRRARLDAAGGIASGVRAANLRDPEADSRRVLRRPDDAARGGADLLLADVAVPGGAAGDLAAGPRSASTRRPTTRSSATCARSRRTPRSCRWTARCGRPCSTRAPRRRRW